MFPQHVELLFFFGQSPNRVVIYDFSRLIRFFFGNISDYLLTLPPTYSIRGLNKKIHFKVWRYVGHGSNKKKEER